MVAYKHVFTGVLTTPEGVPKFGSRGLLLKAEILTADDRAPKNLEILLWK